MTTTRKQRGARMVAPSGAPYHVYRVVLELEDILGGYPGTIDAARAFLQNPMLSRRVPAEAREEFLAQEREFLSDGPASLDIVRTGFRRSPDRTPLLGNYQIKAMLQGAARALYDPGTRPNIYQVARAIAYGMEITPRLIPIRGGEDGGTRQIAQIIAHPRQPSIRVPSTRERDVWLGGQLAFALIVLARGAVARVLTPDEIANLFEAGGMFIGLGTDRGYGHGRFRVVTLDGPEPAGADVVPTWALNPARRGLGYVRRDRRHTGEGEDDPPADTERDP